jgi:hypothetical protein
MQNLERFCRILTISKKLFWNSIRFLLFLNYQCVVARNHGLVVKADGSCPRGHGFKPRHRRLDGCKRFASYYIKEKLKIKVAKWGTPKKKI